MVSAKKKVVVFDYEALEAKTSSEFVNMIREQCDSEKYGYVSTIVRFEIFVFNYEDHYPGEYPGHVTTRLKIICAEKHVRSKEISHHCHKFKFDLHKPEDIDHSKISLSRLREFNKLSIGLKDVH